MSAYLKFYELDHSAFEDESESKVVLGTKALRDALSAISEGLEEGAARICVNGPAGMGKTSLARALPKLLAGESRVAVILHPSASWNSIRSSISKQWKAGEGGLARSNLLSVALEARLVLVIDEAEYASTDILDHIDVLLSYRTEDNQPVVQSVLFANLTAKATDAPAPVLWWLDRIQTLELQFAPLPRDGVGSYIQKHLKRAGWKEDSLFSAEAAHAIHGYTGGIPGEVDRVCEWLLNEGAERNLRSIDARFVHDLLDDQAEENSSTYDTFEELVMEDAFVGAGETEPPEAQSTPSLQETLEHFSTSDVDEGPDAASDESRDALTDEFVDAQCHTDDENCVEDGVEVGVGVGVEDNVEANTEVNVETAHQSTEPVDLAAPDAIEAVGSNEMPLLELGDEALAATDSAEVDLDSEDDVVDDDSCETNDFDDNPWDDSPVNPELDDSSLIELESYLSQPASDKELRALTGSGWGGFARKAAMLAFAITVGGMTLAWLRGDEDISEPPNESNRTDVSSLWPAAKAKPTLFASPSGLSAEVPEKPVLARLRGPVVKPEAMAVSELVEPNHDSDESPAESEISNGMEEPDESPPAAVADPVLEEGPR